MNGNQADRPERTTLVLSSKVNSWLDSQRVAMRQKTGTCMSRSELLRAIVLAVSDFAEVNLSDCKTAEDIGVMMFCGELDSPPQPATKEIPKC